MTQKILLLFGLCLLLTGVLAAEEKLPPNAVDISEKVYRFQKFINFGDRGFGVHDIGEKTFKIFDWELNLLKKIPIAQGEGPSEIRQWVNSAGWTADGYLFLHGYNEFKIIKYDPSGKFMESYKTDFQPYKIIEKDGKIYVFNIFMEMTSNKSPFLQIIDGSTGKTIKKSFFQTVPDPDSPKEIESIHYKILIDKKGFIYILSGLTPAIFKVTEDGKILKRINLPFLDKQVVERSGTNRISYTINAYTELTMINDTFITGFIHFPPKEVKKDTMKIIRIAQDGKTEVEKTFFGIYSFLGGTKNLVYLVDSINYLYIPVDLTKK